MRPTSTARYPRPLIFLHWLMALAVALAYVTGGDPTEAESMWEALLGQVHVACGLTVAALLLLRVPLRLVLGAPAPLPGAVWPRRAAAFLQAGLYALMLLVPLAGWCALAHEAVHFSVLGWSMPLPNGSSAWVRALGRTHEALGQLFIAAAGLHTAAALLHHAVLRDDTLRRMLPGGSGR